MIKKTLLLFFIFQKILVSAQELSITAQPIGTEFIDCDYIVDNADYNDIFYVKNNVLYRKNKKELWQYQNIDLGKITKISIQNPLKIMLFYENFNTIILLDNQLNEIQKINLSLHNIPIIATSAGIAWGNKLWLYNSTTQQIGLFDYLKNNYQVIGSPFQESIKEYETTLNTFLWIDSLLDYYSCNVFGKITSLGKINTYDHIQLLPDHNLLYSNKGRIVFQNIENHRIYTIENVEKSFQNFYYKDQILSIFTPQGITNYKITLP